MGDTRFNRRTILTMMAAAPGLVGFAAQPARAEIREITLDFATYNPVGLILKDKAFLEEALAPEKIGLRWVQSLGSNKALEFLNSSSIDFGSTYAAAALLGRINGNPVKAIYVYTRPTGVELLKTKGSALKSVADLKGKRVAVTRGTDPHIFLIRALAKHGLSEKDINSVLLQHADGRAALARGDVDAWSGLDPLSLAAEIDDGAEVLYRDPALSTWGFLNVREAFAKENPELVRKVVAAYEKARLYALAHPVELQAALVKLSRLPDYIIANQLKREDLSESRIGETQRAFILDAGRALQQAGVVDAKVNVEQVVDDLVDTRFAPAG